MEMTKMTKLECLMTTEDRKAAFTLMELLLVIVIIVILVGLAFPAFQGVLERTKKMQAKNDLTQIVTAVNAFYTEYGTYPTLLTPDTTATYGPAAGNTNDLLVNELRACHLQNGVLTDPSCSAASVLNTRQIVYISPPAVKVPANPRAGIGIPGTGAPTPVGQYWDPWGTAYNVRIDGDYDNSTTNPYGSSGGAGVDPIQQGVIAWSYGKDKKPGNNGNNVYKTSGGVQSDDVISWQ
jgi:prepilin-type N-terminal cleavage/methylation domain-containing protein